MCPPDHYGIEYEINPWMHRQRPTHRARAARQWQSLHQLLIENRAEVCLLPPRPGQPDLVFTANAALIYRDLAVPARFRHGERRGVRRAALLHDRRYFSDRKWRR
jgi:N-dimethylarginine dimethylaminohydrolase